MAIHTQNILTALKVGSSTGISKNEAVVTVGQRGDGLYVNSINIETNDIYNIGDTINIIFENSFRTYNIHEPAGLSFQINFWANGSKTGIYILMSTYQIYTWTNEYLIPSNIGNEIIRKIKNGVGFTISFKIKDRIDSSVPYKFMFENPTLDGVPFDDSIRSYNLMVGGKSAKMLSINGHDLKTFNIDGHLYSLLKDIKITEDEVENFVNSHLTWNASGDTAILDGTQKIKGFYVSYSKLTGLTDGESITVTILFDKAIGDSINGTQKDLVFSNIVIANQDRTVVEADVTYYIDSNINWSGTSGNLDVTKWAASYPHTKLYIADIHMVSGTEYTFTVQADHGYTVNGGTTFDVKYTPNSPKIDITVTKNEVTNYINNNIVWTGDNGVIDYTKWATTGTTLSGDTNVVSGTEYTFTVQVDHGYTVNGGTTFDVKYTPNSPKTTTSTWYLGVKDGIKKLEDDKFIFVVRGYDMNSGFMTQVSDGTIYVGTKDGTWKFINEKLVYITGPRDQNGFMTQVSDGTIYIGTSLGLQKLEDDKFVDVDSTRVDGGFMTQVSDGTIYVGTFDKGLKKLVNGSLVDVDSTDVNQGFMTQVSDGTIYVGTLSGLKKLVNGSLVDVDSTDVGYGFMTQVSDGTIYVGAHRSGLKKLVNDKLVDVDSTNVWEGFMTQVSDGTIYVGTLSGLKKLVNDKLVDVDSTNAFGGWLEEVNV